MNAFRSHRHAANLSQKQVAQAIKVDQTAVSKWERSKSQPRAELLPQIAKLFNCTIDELLTTNGKETA